jgi:hypothetical protein
MRPLDLAQSLSPVIPEDVVADEVEVEAGMMIHVTEDATWSMITEIGGMTEGPLLFVGTEAENENGWIEIGEIGTAPVSVVEDHHRLEVAIREDVDVRAENGIPAVMAEVTMTAIGSEAAAVHRRADGLLLLHLHHKHRRYLHSALLSLIQRQHLAVRPNHKRQLLSQRGLDPHETCPW